MLHSFVKPNSINYTQTLFVLARIVKPVKQRLQILFLVNVQRIFVSNIKGVKESVTNKRIPFIVERKPAYTDLSFCGKVGRRPSQIQRKSTSIHLFIYFLKEATMMMRMDQNRGWSPRR